MPLSPEQAGEAVSAIDLISEESATRVYRITIPEASIAAPVEEKLALLAKSVKLPGYRGEIPARVMQERYGAEARRETVNRLFAAAIDTGLPKGAVVAKVEIEAGAEAGDAVLKTTVTYLPALPDPDFSTEPFERLTASAAQAAETGLTTEAMQALLRADLKAQVLDRLDQAYRFPLPPGPIARELALIMKASAVPDVPSPTSDPNAKAARAAEFRLIAERRVRLGYVVTELARRFGIQSANGAELEGKVIERLLAASHLETRPATNEELLEMAEE